ncbi:MAG: polysaccharide deacetylase family protein [Fibrobacter sp.]|nr:polysaccharide deacetylase family protein [Fibrobacter sp.]
MIFTSFINILLGPAILGGAATLLFGYQKHSGKKPGLLFHSVSDNPGKNMSQYSTANFKNLVDKLKNYSLKTVSLNRYGHSTAEDEILLTFDDGFECIYKNAVPVLENAGFKGSIFCVAGFAGKESDWDVYESSRHMSKEQIIEVSNLGYEIGSHTLTHANLPFLSVKDLEKELKESKQILEDITGKPVRSLSFPFGSFNRRVWEKALEAGYTSASLYRGNSGTLPGLFPVYGVYRFDGVSDIMRRINDRGFSISVALARMMSHFSKGTSVWKFRKEYILP